MSAARTAGCTIAVLLGAAEKLTAGCETTAPAAHAAVGARSTGLLPDRVGLKDDGPGPEDFIRGFRPVPSGRCWFRTSDPRRVKTVLYR